MPRCMLCGEHKKLTDPNYNRDATWALIEGKPLFFCSIEHKKKYIERYNELRAQARERLKNSKAPD